MAQQSDENENDGHDGQQGGQVAVRDSDQHSDGHTAHTEQAAEPPPRASDAPDIVPFWRRLPRFFLYPLHGQPLTYTVLLSLLTPLSALFPALTVHFFIWLLLVLYAYETLGQTAAGRLKPAEHDFAGDAGRSRFPYGPLAVFIVLGVLLVLAWRAGGAVYYAALLCALLALPAVVINLAAARRFLTGLNPVAAIGAAKKIGLPYLALCGIFCLLYALAPPVMQYLEPRLPGWLALPVRNFVAMYFTLIMFNLMGYVAYQYHLPGADVAPENAGGAASETRDENANDDAGEVVAEEAGEPLVEVVDESANESPNDNANESANALADEAPSEDGRAPEEEPGIARFLATGLGDAALTLFDEMRQRDADFTPAPEQLLPLAQALRGRHRFKEALLLLRAFDKRFPGHADIPAVYLFAAQVLSENLHQDALAQRILNTLSARFPEHPAHLEAQQLRAAIEEMQAQQLG